MEIKLGITHVTRELTIESGETPEEVEQRLASALESDQVFSVEDVNGRKVLVPAQRIGYVELGSPNARPVGFGRV